MIWRRVSYYCWSTTTTKKAIAVVCSRPAFELKIFESRVTLATYASRCRFGWDYRKPGAYLSLHFPSPQR